MDAQLSYKDELEKNICEMLYEIKDADLKDAALEIFKKYKHDYLRKTAGKCHHLEEGGLAEHSLDVTSQAIQISKMYDYAFNTDVIIFSGMFHDLGKIQMTSDNIVNHGAMSIALIHGFMNDVDEDTRDMIYHCINNHMLFDTPLCKEVVLINTADTNDAFFYRFEQLPKRNTCELQYTESFKVFAKRKVT